MRIDGQAVAGQAPATPLRLLAERTSGLRSLPGALPALMAIAAIPLWLSGMAVTDIGQMNDLGLVSVLPPQVYASILLLVGAAFLLLMGRRPANLALSVILVLLVVALYAMPIVLEQVPRMAVTWVHDGFIEYIRRTGTVAPGLEARFDWPGFFILGAFLSTIAGLPDSLSLAAWAPVYFELAYLLPLALIFRALTPDLRLVWAGLFLFELTNWIGQDYFSPQAVNYFLYLVILAAFLTWFRVQHPRSERLAAWLDARGLAGRLIARGYAFLTPDELPARPLSGRQQAAVVAAIIVIFAFVSYSHQLTPFFTVAGVLALALFNRTSLRSLPILMGVMALAWVSYMTVPFLEGHVVSLLKEIGQLGATVSSNVVNRVVGSPEHQFVVTFRLAFTLALWALAALGALVRYRDGRRDATLALLAVAPAPLVGIQAYGGELILRLYLFTLPFVVLFAAGLVFGRPAGRPPLLVGLLALGAVASIAGGFLVTRYGNERTDAFTHAEVAGVQALYAMAPAGSRLVAAAPDLPWKFRDFEKYDYVPVTDEVLIGDLNVIVDLMRDPKYPASFFILTRSEAVYAETFAGVSSTQWDAFVRSVAESPEFTQVFENADSRIFVLTTQTASIRP